MAASTGEILPGALNRYIAEIDEVAQSMQVCFGRRYQKVGLHNIRAAVLLSPLRIRLFLCPIL